MFGKNKASLIGPDRFSWWPDWRGECVAIVASGPSTKGANVAALRERIHVIALKENVTLCPWADIVYGCDGPWWRHKRGLPDFNGVKLCQDAATCAEFKLHRIEVRTADKILLDEPAVIGAGGNSGFQALNLAIQFGANGVLLVGFDLHDRDGLHWYGRNTWLNANNPNEDNFRRWRRALEDVAADCKESGIDVVNASQYSALQGYRKMTIEKTLEVWGL